MGDGPCRRARPQPGAPFISVHLVAILLLGAIFLIATVRSIHLGALALSAAFGLGMCVLDGTFKARVSEIASGFPGDLFVVLAGVTYLFAIAKNNGTVHWLVNAAVRSVRGRVGLLPWVMFLVTGLLTAFGAVAPAAVAMIIPIGLGFAARYGLHPVLVGLMIVNGSSAGSFSPLGVFGIITNGVVARNQLAGSPLVLFLASLGFNLVLAMVSIAVFRRVPHPVAAAAPPPGGAGLDEADRLNLPRVATVLLLLALAGGALFFGLDVGFSSFVAAVLLTAIDPKGSKTAINQIAWSTVLLVCGIVTYVSLMEQLGTITFLGNQVAGIGTALVGALLICYLGGVVSAFASTTGILGALIPLAVPFLQSSDVGAVGLIAALAISSSVVDSSPFSTSGSLVIANAREEEREAVYRRVMQWGFAMVLLAPLTAWLVLVLPGWL